MIISIESCTATSNGPLEPVVEDAATAAEAFGEVEPTPALPILLLLAVVDNDGSRCMNSEGSAFTFLAVAKIF